MGTSATPVTSPQTAGRAYRNFSTPKFGVRQQANLRVPMRDGVDLLVDVIGPAADDRFPALVAVSPYPRQIQNTGIPLGLPSRNTVYAASRLFVPVLEGVESLLAAR